MQINRQTYEEFFLSYIDNELDAEGRRAVEAFAFDNPDLAKELLWLQQARIQPEQGIIFLDKKSLFKSEDENAFFNGHIINPGNYEEYFTLYIDNELSAEEKMAVDDFVQAYPKYSAELELFGALKTEPDLKVSFAGKESLYREEERRRFIPWGWKKMAAAALVGTLLSVSAWYYTASNRKDTGNGQLLSGTRQNSRPEVPANPSKEKITEPSVDEARNKVVQSAKTDPLSQQEIAVNAATPRKSLKEKTTAVPVGAATCKIKNPGAAPLLTKTEKAGINRGNTETLTHQKESGITGKGTRPDLIAGSAKRQKIDTGLATAPALSRSVAPSVKPTDAATAVTIKNKQEQKEIATEETDISDDSRTYATESSSGGENALFYIANTSVSRKNRFRGFFRKATRIIEKTAHIEPSAGRESIHIANLEIALQ